MRERSVKVIKAIKAITFGRRALIDVGVDRGSIRRGDWPTMLNLESGQCAPIHKYW